MAPRARMGVWPEERLYLSADCLLVVAVKSSREGMVSLSDTFTKRLFSLSA